MTNLLNQALRLSHESDRQRFKRVFFACFMEHIPYEHIGSSSIEGYKHWSDIDMVVLVDNGKDRELIERFMKEWSEDGSNIPEQKFTSYKSGIFNLIVCYDKKLYGQYVAANELVVNNSLTNKGDRVDVFNYMMDREGKPSLEKFTELITRGKKTPEELSAVEDAPEEFTF